MKRSNVLGSLLVVGSLAVASLIALATRPVVPVASIDEINGSKPVAAHVATEAAPVDTVIVVNPVVILAPSARKTAKVTAPRSGECNFESRPLVQGPVTQTVRGFCGG